jgi:hypothetical protein
VGAGLLAAGQVLRLGLVAWQTGLGSGGFRADVGAGLLAVSNAVPETVVVLVAAAFAAGGREGGLLAGLVAAACELLRQVTTVALLGFQLPGRAAATAFVVLTAAAALGLFAWARTRIAMPDPGPPARGAGIRNARLALAAQAGLALALAAWGAWGMTRGLGREIVDGALTMLPMLLGALYLLRRPTRLAIGLAFAVEAAWVLVGLLGASLYGTLGAQAVGLAVALVPAAVVAGLLLWVRPAPLTSSA